ncbi:MAG TPA: universal stress protein [Acidimicrobiia bacterium]|nr:universal stress protein [Acidimicrobiia bacterium]
MSPSDRPSGRPRLVFGDDGAPPADTAWRWLTSQEWSGWDIEVMTADTDDTRVKWGEPPAVEEWTPTWGRSEAIPGAVAVRFLKAATDPRAMLADREDADVILLGLSAHSMLRGMVTGSTTEWLLHHPPSPLVVAQSPEQVNKVTVCADGSTHSRAALGAFTALPLASETRVTVLAVDDGRTDARHAAQEAAALLDGKVREVSMVVVEGQPTTVILEQVEENYSELVVLGTRGLTGWQRLVLGSTASAVVRGVACTSLVASADMG